MISDWSNLPEHVLVDIFSHLSLQDRFHTSLVCKNWSAEFDSPTLWQSFIFQFFETSNPNYSTYVERLGAGLTHDSPSLSNSFNFQLYQPNDTRYLTCIERYGIYMKYVTIELDQGVVENRESACDLIYKLAHLVERRLAKLSIKFRGENPLFYAGKEFLDALKVLLGAPSQNVQIIKQLVCLDLSEFLVSFESEFLDLISENNQNIQNLNIQNGIFVCKIPPECTLRLVQRCRKLTHFNTFNCSLNEDVFTAFLEADRSPLEFLSIRYRREEKFLKEISSSVWKSVVQKNPKLCVTLYVDNTCPLLSIPTIFKPEIPVAELRLETFTIIYDEINVAASFYRNTLEKLILQTRPSKELNEALLNLAITCHKLRALHVFCVLDKDLIEEILALHPRMKEKNAYTLKWIEEPHPWQTGIDFE